MKPPKGWKLLKGDPDWIWRQEKVAHERWLLVFFNHTNDKTLMAAWFNIGKGPWSPDDSSPNEQGYWLRTAKIPHPASMLEVECIAHEWRKDILEGRV